MFIKAFNLCKYIGVNKMSTLLANETKEKSAKNLKFAFSK